MVSVTDCNNSALYSSMDLSIEYQLIPAFGIIPDGDVGSIPWRRKYRLSPVELEGNMLHDIIQNGMIVLCLSIATMVPFNLNLSVNPFSRGL